MPRIALTRAWDRFHLKALYSRAFRTPALVVVADSTGALQAEQTTNYELEAGYIFGGGFSCSANVFNMMVARPIIYSADESIGSASDAYFNGQDISSVGIETELRWDRRSVSSYLSYSYYQAGRNDEPYVRADSRRFLGAPAHKVTLNETVHVTKNADWNVNAFWLADRYAYTDAGLSRLSSELVVNSFLAYRIGRGSIGLGAANLFNSRRLAPQPYDGGTAPFVLKGREYFLKFAVTF